MTGTTCMCKCTTPTSAQRALLAVASGKGHHRQRLSGFLNRFMTICPRVNLTLRPVAPLVTSNLSDCWIVNSNLVELTQTGDFSHTMPNSRQRVRRGYTTIDLTIDEEKRPLDLLRDKRKGMQLRRMGACEEKKGEEDPVLTILLCDPG